MAIVTAYTYSFSDSGGGYSNGQDLSALPVNFFQFPGVSIFQPPGHVVQATSGVYAVETPINSVAVSTNTLTGADLAYDGSNRLVGGVITGWNQWVGGGGPDKQFPFIIEGVSVPATTFAAWIATGGVAVAPVLLAGDDSISGSTQSDTLWGYAGNDVILGGAGSDDINGNMGNDTAAGGAGNDLLHGGQGEDNLNGNGGDDTLDGDLGRDTVHGGQGNDGLSGRDGDDQLYGDLGSDTLSGGAGADDFHVTRGMGRDVVTDFNVAEGDRIVQDVHIDNFTMSQVGADLLIDLYEGDSILLLGVRLKELPDGWGLLQV